jgi:predicted N-formylglutamate amidohydrolase
LITCEHASSALPPGFDLGVSSQLLDSHWGWDRWAWDTLQRFAGSVGATTVGAKLSRLLVDLNRGPADATLMRPDAGGLKIPGNQGLTPVEVERRLARYYRGYHEAIDRELARLVSIFGRERVVFFTFHSFTGHYGDEDRDFDVGVLFDADEDLAAGVKRALATAGLRVRLNEPYSGFRGEIYSASVHAEAHDVATFEIELNQHVLEDPRRRARIAEVFRSVVPAIQPHLPSRPRHNGGLR